MKSTIKLLGVSVVAFSCVAVACGDDDGTGGGGGDATTSTKASGPGSTASTGTGGGMPMVPTLGTQVDRMGRPGINTVTTDTFIVSDAEREAAEDTYNQADDRSEWVATFSPGAQTSLAILDSLDANCGNQLGACDDETMGCYDTLATVLMNDWLIVRGDAPNGCNTYLGVEADTVLMAGLDDCGGRVPFYDVIDTSYSVLATGAFGTVSDEIDAPMSATNEVFPYLAAPN
jgi:hypothetical protein